MKISHIEHIGIAVPNLEKAIEYYENVLGLKCYKKEVVEDQKVTTAFIMAKFIEKNGGRGGMHHIAFAVEDGVAEALAEAEEKGVKLIDKAPRNGADGLKIAFLHPKSTEAVLTELCENPNK